MNTTFQNNHLNQEDITYEYCHEAYSRYLLNGKTLPCFISGWDVSQEIFPPVNLVHKIIPQIVENVNRYYLVEDDIGKTEIIRYLSTYGMSLNANQILVANSATSLLCHAIFSVTSGQASVLVLNPAYFSVQDSLSLLKRSCVSIEVSLPDFTFDCNKIEKTLHSLDIKTIILTDPIFGSGIPISEENLKSIIYLANRYHCTLIVDMARYGLLWTDSDEPLLGERLTSLQEAERYVVVYSPCKKIFANGIKTGILIASCEVAKELSCYSDSVLGSVSAAQIEFLKVLLSPESKKYIKQQMENNISRIMCQYEIVESITLNSHLKTFKPTMGHYALACCPLHGQQHKAIFRKFLDEALTFTLPMALYGLADGIHYLFRINLLTDINELTQSLFKISAILENS